MINFTTLYDKHIDNLFAFGSRFTSDREMIKDCIQDVFVKLYTRRDSLDNVDKIESYLYVSLRRAWPKPKPLPRRKWSASSSSRQA